MAKGLNRRLRALKSKALDPRFIFRNSKISDAVCSRDSMGKKVLFRKRGNGGNEMRESVCG